MDQVSRLPDRGPQRRWVPQERVYTPALAAPPRYTVQRQPDAAPDFLETLRKIGRHWKLIIVCMLACTGIAGLIVQSMPTRYLAEAKVLVGVPEMRVMNVESIIANMSPTAERVQNEAFVMQSRELAQQVIDRLDLSNDPEFNPQLMQPTPWQKLWRLDSYVPASWIFWRDSAPLQRGGDPARRLRDRIVDNLLAQVSVSSLGRSHVLSVEAESTSPARAAQIANTLAEAYLRQQKQDKLTATDQAEKFLNVRIAELRAAVEKSEQAAEEYRRKNNLYKGATTGVTSQQLTELNTQLIMAQTTAAEANSRLREAQTVRGSRTIGEAAPDVLRSPTIQALKAQLSDAERKMADLSSNYGDQHPKMAAAKAEVTELRRRINGEIERTVDSLKHEANAASARYGALKSNLDQLQRTLGGVNERSIQLDALERDAAVNRKLLENMLGRARETTGTGQLQQPDARLISSAAPSEKAAFPPKSLIVFLAAVGGILIGMLLAMLRESADRTFRTGEQVEHATGLPVLALVPSLTGRVQPAQHVLRKPVSPYAESLRKIYIGLQLSENERSPKVVQISSATPAEGKSVLVASLGRMLASHGRRVLLIDCDWRRPSLHRFFNRENRDGLANLLCGEEVALDRVIHNDAVSGADVIVAGNWKPQGIHQLTGERMEALLKTFAKNYDLVILDTPPVLVGAEVLPLARLVDKVIFVVRWGKTGRESALDALRQLLDAQADVAGVVLSRVDATRYRAYSYGHLNYQYVRPTFSPLR